MKLSKIVLVEGFISVTVDIYQHYVVGRIYGKGKAMDGTLKVWKKLDLDIPLEEANLDNVKHLGIKRYRHWVHGNQYVNVYNYEKN